MAAALQVARARGVPVTARGAGTSVAGNAIGPGIVLDFSRHLNRVVSIDPHARTAVVEPGVVHAALQRAAAPHGLRFGPDPSTHTRCTIGGMIGNDACGSRSLAYGRTADNVIALSGITGSGAPLRTGDGADAGELGDRLRALVAGNLAPIRTELGRFDRQISGYALQNLLPEKGFDLTRMLVGSEGTLLTLTQATVRLVTDPAHRVLVALGFADFAAAGYASPAVVRHRPTACEGLDARIVDTVRERRGPAAVPDLPRGNAWLFVEFGGDDIAELIDRGRALLRDIDAMDGRIVSGPAEMAALWRIREDGAGLAGRAPSGRPAWPGWEDAAVPPAALGDYLTEFDALVADAGLTMMPFGHFGDGCLHVRLDFDLHRPGDLRAFLRRAAELVARFGGSLSGEHGDGRARSELLPTMYGPDVLNLFGAVKAIFDPSNLLNPGVLVDPAPLDADLRVPPTGRGRTALALRYPADGGSLSDAVHRCTGVGRCRVEETGPAASTTVMCPSFQATREEKDSTRARARVLQDAVAGRLDGGWRSAALHDALDLCLSCKGCATDCPTGIDMATYKAEALYQRYRWRPRPRSHYSLGRLPRWARLAARAPRLANALTQAAVLRPGRAMGGRGGPAAGGAAIRRADVPRLVRRAAGVGQWRHPGGPLRRHLHRFLHPAGRPGRRAGARIGRLPGCPASAELLWADLDLDRPAGRRAPDPAPHGRRPGRVRRTRDADRRAGAVVHRGAPTRRRRAARLTGGGRCGPLDPHAGRAIGSDRGVAPARPGRNDSGRPTALPPSVRAGLVRRRDPARPGRRRCDQAGRMLRPGRQLRGRDRTLRGVREGREHAVAAGPVGGRRCGGAGRRVLLPHSDHRSGRAGVAAPRRAARRCEAVAPC